jgi:ABC-type multidrug transport system ATPase subunit/uncharacterized tellurite resistance protein B-like protein
MTGPRWPGLVAKLCQIGASTGVEIDAESPLIRLGLAVALLSAKLAQADGVVLSEERAALEQVLGQHLGFAPALAGLLAGFAFGLDPAAAASDQELMTRLATVPLEERLAILDGLFAVAAVDQTLDPREEQLIERVARGFGVEQAAYHEVLARWGLRRGGAVEIPLGAEDLTIGRGSQNHIRLADLAVSEQHAVLEPFEGGWQVRDLGSARLTWVNGAPIQRHRLQHGDRIRIESTLLEVDLDGQRVRVWDATAFALVVVDGLSYQVGRSRRILDEISCSFCSGEMVAILGPSGSGKTTLLDLILGKVPATSGRILLNGEPCPGLARRYTHQLGVVPQDDIVYPPLTVEESLFYAGCLRSVPGVRSSEVREAVDRALADLELERIRTSRIGDPVSRGVSGGERKRVTLGQELLNSTTRFLVLDEPTAGLDPHTNNEIFQLLRGLANDGRLVVVVTHQIDEATFALFDKVVMLGAHGKQVYVGPPGEVLATLGVPTVPELFARLKDPVAAGALTARFAGSPIAQHGRKLSEILTRNPAAPRNEPAASGGLSRALRYRVPVEVRTFARQLVTLTRRYFRVKLRDTGGILLGLAQVPLIVVGTWLVLSSALRHDDGPVVPGALPFVLVVSAFWLGAASSVREIVADQAILRHERMMGLGLAPYVLSKLAILCAWSVLQCLIVVALAELCFGLGARHVDLVELGVVLGLVACFGTALGLCVSAACRSSEAAVMVLPGLVIPQLLFAGMLVPFDSMPAAMRWVSFAMASRWGMDGVLHAGASVTVNGCVQRELSTLFFVADKSVPPDLFLEQLGLAHPVAQFGPSVPDASFAHDLVALGLLFACAGLAIGILLKLRRL